MPEHLPPAPRRRRVLFYVADQWRGDTMTAEGHPCVDTPNLDALAADGVTFRRHYSTTSPCGPARTSMLTGLYQMNHRVVRNGTPLDARHTNIAYELRKAGIAPGMLGYTSNVPDPRVFSPQDPLFRDHHGVMQGFDALAPGLPWNSAYMGWVEALGYDLPDKATAADTSASRASVAVTRLQIAFMAPASNSRVPGIFGRMPCG